MDKYQKDHNGARTCRKHHPRAHEYGRTQRPTRLYRIRDAVLAVVVIFCAISVLWGYGMAYQIGYSAAEQFAEVHHD